MVDGMTDDAYAITTNNLTDEDMTKFIESQDEDEDTPHQAPPDFLNVSSPAIRDSLQIYLREVNAFPMLQPDEEFDLARRYREQGDAKAAFRLISSHLRLVVRIAMDFQRSWMQNILDLIQEGNVGLMKALQKFDPDRGIKFSYYASFWINAYILKFIMDNWRMVKVGTTQTQRKLFYNLDKERQRLLSQGFDADTSSLSKSLDVSEREVTEMDQRLGSADLSLDAPFSDDSSLTRMEMLPAPDTPVEDLLAEEEMVHMLKRQIKKMMPLLNDKEHDILKRRLMTEEPVTLREIGEKHNITRERVRQIEARLIQKIRDNFSENLQTTAHQEGQNNNA
jgi:RNA polymerase sigma-32 factor